MNTPRSGAINEIFKWKSGVIVDGEGPAHQLFPLSSIVDDNLNHLFINLGIEEVEVTTRDTVDNRLDITAMDDGGVKITALTPAKAVEPTDGYFGLGLMRTVGITPYLPDELGEVQINAWFRLKGTNYACGLMLDDYKIKELNDRVGIAPYVFTIYDSATRKVGVYAVENGHNHPNWPNVLVLNSIAMFDGTGNVDYEVSSAISNFDDANAQNSVQFQVVISRTQTGVHYIKCAFLVNGQLVWQTTNGVVSDMLESDFCIHPFLALTDPTTGVITIYGLRLTG